MKTFAMVILVQICVVGTLLAQSKTGTTVGQFLLIEPSARAAGMGNAGVSMYEDILSAYYNPAAIGQFTNYGVQATHSLWPADIAYDYVGVAVHTDSWGNLYASLTSLNSGEIDVTTVSQPLGTGERYTVNDMAMGIGYGAQISDRFSAGVEVSYVQETIWHSSLTAFALNVGTIYRISPDGLRLGASISNFGTQAKYAGRDLYISYDQNTSISGDNSALPGEVQTGDFFLPIVFRIGISYPWKIDNSNKLQLALDAFHPNENTESMSIGGEWSFRNTFMVRAGYQNLFQQDSETGLALGTGVLYDGGGYDIHLDYAWSEYGRLQNVQRFSVGISF
jgi:long-subunit fatty acid transport protein